MNKRVSITLAICMLCAGIALFGLILPARRTSDAAPATAEVVAAEPTSTAAAARTVSIADFAFGGATVVQPGEQITVSNVDGTPHTMTAKNGSFDTGIIGGGAATTLTMPTEPGTYQYFCSLHPSMVAEITVQP